MNNRNENRDTTMHNRDDSRTIQLKNLNKLTLPQTIMSYFDKFGDVEDVTLTLDDNEEKTGMAIVVFK